MICTITILVKHCQIHVHLFLIKLNAYCHSLDISLCKCHTICKKQRDIILQKMSPQERILKAKGRPSRQHKFKLSQNSNNKREASITQRSTCIEKIKKLIICEQQNNSLTNEIASAPAFCKPHNKQILNAHN